MASNPKKVKLVEDDHDEQQEKGDAKELLGQTLAEEETKTNKEEQEMTRHLELIPCKEFSLADLLGSQVPLEELPTEGFTCNCKHLLNPETNK